MADLRALLERLGFTDARSLLASGNLVFGAGGRGGAALEKLLEAETAKRLDLTTDFMVRAAGELAAVVDRNPFPGEAKRDPGHLLVMFLKDRPTAAAAEALQAALTGPEVGRVDGKHAYIYYAAGVGRSKLTNTVIERKLGTRATGRNWNTVLKLQAMAAAA
jgi:uncharacterized protein (DUF1697 family)